MIVIILLPLVIGLFLTLIPTGRGAALGIGVAALMVAATLILPVGTGGLAQGYALLAAPGIVVAALAHGLRAVTGPLLPVWAWALIVAGAVFGGLRLAGTAGGN